MKRKSARLLVTGFGAFRDIKQNTSKLLLERIGKQSFNGLDLETRLLPVTFSGSSRKIKEAIKGFKPDILVMFGVAADANGFRIEKVAVNVANKSPNQREKTVDPKAPAGYFSKFPMLRMEKRLRAQGIPANISYSAGTYVCNNVFFAAAHYIESKGLGTRYGFIHLPLVPDEAARLGSRFSSMSMETVISGFHEIVGILRREP